MKSDLMSNVLFTDADDLGVYIFDTSHDFFSFSFLFKALSFLHLEGFTCSGARCLFFWQLEEVAQPASASLDDLMSFCHV